MPTERIYLWAQTYLDLVINDDDDNDSDSNNNNNNNNDNGSSNEGDAYCAGDERSEDMGKHDSAVESQRLKQRGDYLQQGKKRFGELIRTLKQQLEIENQTPNSAVSVSGAGAGVEVRCLYKQRRRRKVQDGGDSGGRGATMR